MALARSIWAWLIPTDALAISVSPVLQKRSKPAPEPMESMVIWPEKPSSLYMLAISSETGYTVDEPALTTVPVAFEGSMPGSILSGSSLLVVVQVNFPWANTLPAISTAAVMAAIFFMLSSRRFLAPHSL